MRVFNAVIVPAAIAAIGLPAFAGSDLQLPPRSAADREAARLRSHGNEVSEANTGLPTLTKREQQMPPRSAADRHAAALRADGYRVIEAMSDPYRLRAEGPQGVVFVTIDPVTYQVREIRKPDSR